MDTCVTVCMVSLENVCAHVMNYLFAHCSNLCAAVRHTLYYLQAWFIVSDGVLQQWLWYRQVLWDG